MDKKDQMELLKNKKETISQKANFGLAVILSFLAVATPITASAIIYWQDSKATTIMLTIYFILGFFTLKNPLKQLYDLNETIQKIDNCIYLMKSKKDPCGTLIKELYSTK